MAGSLNKCQFIGHLGADPEIKSLNSGDRVCNLRLAVSESWKDKHSGERKEKTEWVRVVIFNDGLVKVAESYLQKGSYIYIEGQLQTRKWKNQAGEDQYSTEIVLQKFRGELKMLDKKGDREDRGGGSDSGGRGDRYESDQGFGGGGRQQDFSADLDDEIPF